MFGKHCSTVFQYFLTSDVVETETWLKFRDETSSKNSETETSNFVHFAEIKKNIVITSDLIFFRFLAFFRRVLVVSYLQIQQTKNRWIIEISINHFFAIFKVSRPETFESETRPDTFETETRENGSRDSTTIKHLAFKGPPTSIAMCKYLAFKGATNSNCNLQVL